MAERPRKRARSSTEEPPEHESFAMDAEVTSSAEPVPGGATKAWTPLDYMTLLAADSPDVLTSIYAHAHCTVAVSRQLLPFSQMLLYPRVLLTTQRQLHRFIRTIVADRRGTVTNLLPPERLVLELSVEMDDDDDIDMDLGYDASLDEGERRWDEYLGDGGLNYTIDLATLQTFLARLTSLRYLKVNDLRQPIHAIVTPLPGTLPRLERLVIGWIGATALDPAFYVGLDSYPKLEHLSLHVGFEDYGDDPPGNNMPFALNQNVMRLQLALIDGEAALRSCHLLSLFSQLEELSIEIDPTFSLQPGVSLADVNPQLKRLTFTSRQDEMPPPPLPILKPIDLIINRFRFLETLHLSPRTFTPNLFPLLSRFPYLVFLSIEITSYSEIISSSLLGIIKGPRPIPNLRALFLNDVSPSYSNSPPKWTPDISFQFMVNLVNAAEEVGVHFGGNVVDRYDYELEVQAEKKMLEMGIDGSKFEDLGSLGLDDGLDDEALFQKALMAMNEKGGGGLSGLMGSGELFGNLFG